MSSTLIEPVNSMYSLQKLEHVNLDVLQLFFDELPLDPYLEDRYRYRRFSSFQVSSEHLVQLPHQYFLQKKEYNRLLGDIRREYLELDDRLTAAEDFRKLTHDFLSAYRSLPEGTEMGIHQIRIVSSDTMPGYPAPEGIHVDGFDLVGIFCVDRCDITGGETYLYESRDGEPVYCTTLEPGDLLVFDDRKLLHYTSPIQTSSTACGKRDVFIFTAKVATS